MMKNHLHNSIEILDTKSISEKIISEIQNLLQDMWATSLGEMIICKECDQIFSKEDIFSYLPSKIYGEKVHDIMKNQRKYEIPCSFCKSETDFIYGEKHKIELERKIKQSVYSHLTISHGGNQEINGIGLYYIDSLTQIYEQEFEWHYKNIGLKSIQKRVDKILSSSVNQMICFAAIGFQEGNISPFLLFEFLKGAFEKIPDQYKNLPGIMEVDKTKSTYLIFTKIGGIPLEYDQKQLKNKRKEYESTLIIFEKPVETFESFFSGGPREYIRKTRG